MRPTRRARGFLIIAAVFLIVVLAGLVAYLMSVSTTSQAASVADINSARAYQAARTGIEWAAYQVLRDPGGGTFRSACAAGTATRNQTYGGQLAGFTATITCTGTGPITEGATTTLTVFTIVSNACNEPSGSACPNAATTSTTYVERQLTVTLTN
jgi:MSHA biogenesis protein MshP